MPQLNLTIGFDEEKPVNLMAALAAWEKSIIRAALDEGCGVRARAARMLGLNRTTLVEKMRKYDLPLNEPSKKKS